MILPIASIACNLMLVVCAGAFEGWEKHWRRFKLTPEQVPVAEQRMLDSLRLIRDVRRESLAKKDVLQAKHKVIEWRTSKISERFGPLCRLFIARPSEKDQKGNQNQKLTYLDGCSCFFVKPTIAMTAAHCLFPVASDVDGNGKTVKKSPIDISPEAGFVLFLVRHYGIDGEDEGAHRISTTFNRQLVLEHWTASKWDEFHFQKPRGDVKDADLAFLKVGLSVGQAHYTLTLPKGHLGGVPSAVECNYFKSPSTMILGYPVEYKGGEVALNVVGTIEPFNKDLANLMTEKEIAFFGAAFRNWWYAKGSIGGGASGGPWIAGENSKGLPKECEMGVFGINHGGCGPEDPSRLNLSALVTVQLIQALNIINGKLEGATATKSVGDNIQFIDLPIE